MTSDPIVEDFTATGDFVFQAIFRDEGGAARSGYFHTHGGAVRALASVEIGSHRYLGLAGVNDRGNALLSDVLAPPGGGARHVLEIVGPPAEGKCPAGLSPAPTPTSVDLQASGDGCQVATPLPSPAPLNLLVFVALAVSCLACRW